MCAFSLNLRFFLFLCSSLRQSFAVRWLVSLVFTGLSDGAGGKMRGGDQHSSSFSSSIEGLVVAAVTLRITDWMICIEMLPYSVSLLENLLSTSHDSRTAFPRVFRTPAPLTFLLMYAPSVSPCLHILTYRRPPYIHTSGYIETCSYIFI